MRLRVVPAKNPNAIFFDNRRLVEGEPLNRRADRL
jgi:hypothetical protein